MFGLAPAPFALLKKSDNAKIPCNSLLPPLSAAPPLTEPRPENGVGIGEGIMPSPKNQIT
jgi:hypothetical protein